MTDRYHQSNPNIQQASYSYMQRKINSNSSRSSPNTRAPDESRYTYI